MKKFICIIAAVAALFILSSCTKEGKSGKVEYSYGFSSASLSGSSETILAQLASIENVYGSYIRSISGASVSESENVITFKNVEYKSTDSSVAAACEEAEKHVSFTMTGSVTFRVTALYYNGGDSKTVYEKTFSN